MQVFHVATTDLYTSSVTCYEHYEYLLSSQFSIFFFYIIYQCNHILVFLQKHSNKIRNQFKSDLGPNQSILTSESMVKVR